MSCYISKTSECIHSNHLFADPICKNQILLKKIANVAFHILTLCIPLAIYHVVSCCFPRKPSGHEHTNLQNQASKVVEANQKTKTRSSEVELNQGSIKKVAGLIKKQPNLVEVSSEEVLKLQNAIENTNDKYSTLDLQEIKKEGFLPINKFEFGEATYYFSKCFLIGSNHAVLALVRIDDKVFPRIFYRSNSQATWRTMPAATKNNGNMGRLGKGLNETDTQLPIAVNLALHSLPQASKGIPDEIKNVVKTAYDATKTYKENVCFTAFAKLKEDAKTAFVRRGMLIPKPPDPKSILLTIEEKLHPDFTSLLYEQKVTVPTYGKIQVKIFASKDKSLQYMYYEMRDGKAFLAGVEKVKENPITPYGNRQEALELHGMDAPLLEYRAQIPEGYDPAEDAASYDKSGKYANNWNFVRECKLVQMYYEGLGRKLPARV